MTKAELDTEVGRILPSITVIDAEVQYIDKCTQNLLSDMAPDASWPYYSITSSCSIAYCRESVVMSANHSTVLLLHGASSRPMDRRRFRIQGVDDYHQAFGDTWH